VGTNVGTGPGEITPDGCAVEFYALLPVMGEAPVVIRQTAPRWFSGDEPSQPEVAGIRRVVRTVRRTDRYVDVEVEYHVGDRTWTHAFRPHRIGESELAGDLGTAGLEFGRWLTDDRSWFTAVPAR
jgi:hypothetical protein